MANVLYFAYGSNMCAAQMRERIPDAEKIGVGRLADYALVWDKQSKIDGSAKANIIERAGSEVWGVVYRLSSDDMRKMDRHERSYEHQHVTVLLQDGAALETVTYISHQRTQNIPPTREYWQRVVDGAKNITCLPTTSLRSETLCAVMGHEARFFLPQHRPLRSLSGMTTRTDAFVGACKGCCNNGIPADHRESPRRSQPL